MKKLVLSLLALVLGLGKTPAWGLVCSQRCMPNASLACLRACAKSGALLTQGGKLASVGQACGRVEVREALPSLTAVQAPRLVLPVLSFALPLSSSPVLVGALSIQPQAHAPPCERAAQAFLSVPVAQAPPVQVQSV